MNVLINKQTSGFKKDIIYNKLLKEYSSEQNYDINVNELLELNNEDTFKSLLEENRKIIDTLNLNNSEINWRYFSNELYLKNRFESLIEEIDQISSNKYEKDIFKIRNNLSNRIKKVYLESEIPVYSHSRSLTGRMTIESGFNYLTSKKEERNLIQSKFEEGAILEIDIKSLEPRVYLKLAQNIEVEDVYEYIKSNVITECNVDRKNIKLAVISALYGGSDRKIMNLSGLKKLQVLEIKKFLKIDHMKEKIINEFEEKGYFENFYGRKIFSVKSPINYFIQSSSADFSCLVYEQFLKMLDDKKFNLVALIHDAIIIDVDKTYVDLFLSLKRLKEDILNLYAPITVNILSKNYE